MDQIFDCMVRDFSKFALKRYSKPRLSGGATKKGRREVIPGARRTD